MVSPVLDGGSDRSVPILGDPCAIAHAATVSVVGTVGKSPFDLIIQEMNRTGQTVNIRGGSIFTTFAEQRGEIIALSFPQGIKNISTQ